MPSMLLPKFEGIHVKGVKCEVVFSVAGFDIGHRICLIGFLYIIFSLFSVYQKLAIIDDAIVSACDTLNVASKIRGYQFDIHVMCMNRNSIPSMLLVNIQGIEFV